MVGYDDTNNALTLGDDDSLSVGDYELEYNSTDDQWQARYGRPIGGEVGAHGEIRHGAYTKDSEIGEYALEFSQQELRGVDIPNKYDTSNISVSVWFKTNVTDDVERQTIIVDRFRPLTLENGSIEINSTGDSDLVGSTYPTGQWNHAVGQYDGSTAELYLNGSQVASATRSWDTPTDFAEIGQNFGGLLDDVRVYNRQLSSSEVTDLSNGVDITNGLVTRHDFEFPETPEVAIDSTGDVYPKNSVPRSTSGSLVPQGLAESVSAGEVLADNGETYSSVQTAVDNASGWVFVGPGTFNENVNISTEGLTLEGCGYDTVIDGGGSGRAISLEAANLVLRNISVRTNLSDGSGCVITNSNADSLLLDSVNVLQSGTLGINISSGSNHIVKNCVVESISDFNAIKLDGGSGIISNCVIDANSNVGINPSSDSVIVNNIIRNASIGIASGTGNDIVMLGNRILNSSDYGIDVGGIDIIIANNRISDSTNADISDRGTGTVLDDNLTGPSN